MAVVCEQCGHSTKRILYRPPGKAHRDVLLLLGIVVGCAFLGFYNLTVALFDVLPIVDKGDELGVPGLEAPGAGLLRDVIQLYENSVRTFLTLMMLVLIAVPARALLLVSKALKGAPHVLDQVRRILILQFSVELMSTLVLLGLAYDLEVIRVPFHFGFNVVLAPLAFLASRRATVEDHFSSFRLESVPTSAPA